MNIESRDSVVQRDRVRTLTIGVAKVYASNFLYCIRKYKCITYGIVAAWSASFCVS